MSREISELRLACQRIARPARVAVADTVRHLVAVQSQDFAEAKWGTGLHTAGSTDAVVERAFDAGEIIRTHVLRPTWHFTAPEDLRAIRGHAGGTGGDAVMRECRPLLPMVRIIACFLVVTAFPPAPLPAQFPAGAAPVDSGAVIRFSTGGAVLRGRLMSTLQHGADSVPYCRHPGPPCDGRSGSPGPAWLDARTLDALEVRTGSAWRTGAVIGGVVGGALFALGASFVRGLCDTADCMTDTRMVATTLVGAVSFGAIGGFIGWLSPRYERRF